LSCERENGDEQKKSARNLHEKRIALSVRHFPTAGTVANAGAPYLTTSFCWEMWERSES
jgi:hypothetical protein